VNSESSAPPGTTSRQNFEAIAKADARKDRAFAWSVGAAAWLVFFTLLAAAGSMFWGGREAFSTFGLSLFTSDVWDPVNHIFGARVPIYGTLVTATIALLIAVPVSLGVAIFLTEMAPGWLRKPVSTAIELLAGIPSIVYGMWGLFVLVPILGEHVFPWLDANLGQLWLIGPIFQGPPIGVGLGTAGLVLAIMILPFISSVMREVFLAVPAQLKESAYALGSTTTEVVWHIVLPYTRIGVIGAIFLGLGRALGETMAVTFLIGNAYNFSFSLLEPSNSIAAAIANEFPEAAAGSLHQHTLIALAFILFALTFVVLVLAQLMLRQLAKRAGT
jgi:phosphate transport system permease protein